MYGDKSTLVMNNPKVLVCANWFFHRNMLTEDRILYLDPGAWLRFEKTYGPFKKGKEHPVKIVEQEDTRHRILEHNDQRSDLHYDGELSAYLRPPKKKKEQPEEEEDVLNVPVALKDIEKEREKNKSEIKSLFRT
jgi:hypothetical protein